MNNLKMEIFWDHQSRKEFHVLAHYPLSQDELATITIKRSLWETVGNKMMLGHHYEIIQIVAADGWEGAE